jgi:hypothetical protein
MSAALRTIKRSSFILRGTVGAAVMAVAGVMMEAASVQTLCKALWKLWKGCQQNQAPTKV